jgi:signal transduction histidine kinase
LADLLSTLKRRSKTLIVLCTGLVLAVVALLQVVHLGVSRRQTLDTAQTRAANLSNILAEHVRTSFAILDAALAQLAVHGARVGGAEASEDAWNPILTAAQAALAGSGSLSVTDKAGIIRHSTIPMIVGEPRTSSYIHQQLSIPGAPDQLVVDRPFLTRTQPTQFIIPAGRRLSTPDASFGGLVVATALPEDYRPFFRSVNVGREGVISVFHPDNLVLFREPSVENPINETAENNPLLVAAKQAGKRSVLRGPLRPGGPAYVSAFTAVDDPSLIVAVSLSEREVLGTWYHDVRSTVLAFGLLTLTLAVIVAIAFRQINARTRAEQDLREVQRVEAERLQDANARLEEALERERAARRETEAASYMKDEFLMTVSHELRTPLNAIYGWVQMLSRDSLPAEQRSRAIAALHRNARAQARLIDDLLDVSGSITGKLRIDPRPTDVGEVALEAIDSLRAALEAKSLTFDVDIQQPLRPILADPDRLQQIIWNLLSNAIKFTPEAGRVGLRVEQSAATASVTITVTDSGAGINPELLPHVFDRFRQGDAGTQRRYGGLGLGLAIVQHLVELHGGTVTATSNGQGTGATFRIVLPAKTIANP